MGDAILRIPRDARVRAYRTRDTYDGVVPATSKRQPYCHSSYIELSDCNADFAIKAYCDVYRFSRIRHALASMAAANVIQRCDVTSFRLNQRNVL